MRNSLSKVTFLAFLAISPYVWADSIPTVMMSGINVTDTQGINLNIEKVNIGVKNITAEYEFENTTDTTLRKTFLLTLPRYSANIEVGDFQLGEPHDLMLKVDGKEVKTHSIIKAYYKNKDISSILKQQGLSDEQIAYFPSYSPFESDVAVKSLSDKQEKALLAKGLLNHDTPEGLVAPAWEVQIQYVWSQNIKAGGKIHITQSYRPFAGVGDDYDVKPLKYCPEPKVLASWDKRATGEKYRYLPGAEVSYAFSKQSPKMFELHSVRTGHELVSSCTDTQAIKEGILNLRMKNKNPSTITLHFSDVELKENLPLKNKTPKIK